MPDYSKCVIYTIRTPNGLYVGATCNFVRRKYGHKSGIYNEKCKEYNYKIYKAIRANNCEWEMKPYSEFPCKSKMEMNIEEERIRRELKPNLNTYQSYSYNKEMIEELIKNKQLITT